MVGHSTNKKGKKTKSATPWIWGPEQQEAFDTIIEKLTSPPVLAYADYTKSFVLNIDASGGGLGDVLYIINAICQRVLASCEETPAVECVLLAQAMDANNSCVRQLLAIGHKPTKRQIALAPKNCQKY